MKNVHIFTTTLPSAAEMRDAILGSSYLFKECEDTDFSTFGFSGCDAVERLANGYRISFTKEEKIIPNAAIKRELDKRTAKAAKEFNGDLSKREISELREFVVSDLVVKAMTKVTTFFGYYHEATNRFVVDVANKNLAGIAISLICHMLKSIETTTLHVSGVSNCLTTNILECISNKQELGFDGFSYADKLHLENQDGETVKFKCDYTLEHVQDLINSGYRVTTVRLSRDNLSFDLTDEFKIKQIKNTLLMDDDFESKEAQQLAENETCLEILSGIVTGLIDFFSKDSDGDSQTPPPAESSGELPGSSTEETGTPALTKSYLDEATEEDKPNRFFNEEGKDSFYDEAVEFVRETRVTSVSRIQRKFRTGYNRSARLIEQMEADGIVSKPGHNGAREVLVPPKAA
tara:strand:- start:1171 stop:2382 length:1212 start_codon:yes stop_codon:yes gene_type:complete